ncbi:armadillo-type protein [Dichotomocladium elegans]|nr:armadillo-type protein [Dichotomocladium elegans]
MDQADQQPQADIALDQSGIWNAEDRKYRFTSYGRVEEQLMAYFKQVQESLDDPPFETAEEQRLFVDAVYHEVEGNELRLAVNPTCSLILEKLLTVSNPFQLRVFCDKLTGRTVELITDRNASHVCQRLVTLAADVVEKEVQDGKPDNCEMDIDPSQGELLSMEQMILNMCEDILPEMGDLICQSYASHVIRVLIFVLAGKRIDDFRGQLRSKNAKRFKEKYDPSAQKVSVKASRTRLVPDSFKPMLQKLIADVAENATEEQLRGIVMDSNGSPVIQVLLEALDDDKESEKIKTMFLDRMLWGLLTGEDTAATQTVRQAWFQNMIFDKVGSHMVQFIIKIAPSAVYKKMYVTLLRGKMLGYSKHAVANYVIQSVLSNARDSSQLKEMAAELGGFKFLLETGKYGVIRSLVEASVKLGVLQAEVMGWLIEAFGLKTDEDKKQFANCLIRMKPLEVYQELSADEKTSSQNFHIQGSLIFQEVMKMPSEQHSVLVGSFLSQKPEDTLKWCFSPLGSRAFESILRSDEVNIKVKKRVTKNLEGRFVALAKDKFGSHIIERCWEVADINTKEQIATELLKKEYDLADHYIGKCILWSCRIDQFKRRRQEWIEREKGLEKRKKMFEDILEEDGKAGNKKRKTKA